MLAVNRQATASPTTEGYDCIINLFFPFLVDPFPAIPDCRALMEPVRFTDLSPLATQYLGTGDLWEN